MLIKILGILDILVALVFWIFAVFDLYSLSTLVLFLGLFLLAKGIVFATTLNIVSFLDILSSIIIIAGTYYDLPLVIVIIISLFLLQKGIFSMLG